MTKYTSEYQTALFWSHVAITANDDLCWLWQHSKDYEGYGHMWFRGKYQRAHRIAWQYPDYVIPPKMHVLHSCDNPACCNPKHLFLGTHQDNMTDMFNKGRRNAPRGEKQGKSILKSEDVIKIRALYAEGQLMVTEIARMFGVNDATIHCVIKRRTWKHI